MRIKISNAGSHSIRPLSTAILVLATTTLLSCASDGSNGSGSGLAGASGTFTDSRDSKSYKWVKIGTQTWMAENLSYNAEGSKCGDDDNTLKDANTATCDTYGRLYDWSTAKSACPDGWHLPSDAEWNILMKLVNPSCADNVTCAVAGTKLKATSNWNDYNGKSGNGTDDFGFAALPSGNGRTDDGSFSGVGDFGRWWSSSENNANDAYLRVMGAQGDIVYYATQDKNNLYGVRCVKN